jgi:hypothetical protein
VPRDWRRDCPSQQDQVLVLRTTVEKAECHLVALPGELTLPKLKFYFKRNCRFVVAYRGTDVKKTFSWREAIDMANDMCFFGKPCGASRDYSRLFCSVWSQPYVQQIYYDIGQETAGDSFALYALSNTFLTCMMTVHKRSSENQSVTMLAFYESENLGGFYTLFDRACQKALFGSVLLMQDNNMPLIAISCFNDLTHRDPGNGTHPAGTHGVTSLVEPLLPCLWANLCALRLFEECALVDRVFVTKVNSYPAIRSVGQKWGGGA